MFRREFLRWLPLSWCWPWPASRIPRREIVEIRCVDCEYPSGNPRGEVTQRVWITEVEPGLWRFEDWVDP